MPLGPGQLCPRPTPQEASVNFIKRVVGGPGDTISVQNGHVIRNGKREPDGFTRPCLGGDGCTFSQPIVVPARRYGTDLDAMAAAVRPDTKIVFIANPNNPTGTFNPWDKVREFLERMPERVSQSEAGVGERQPGEVSGQQHLRTGFEVGTRLHSNRQPAMDDRDDLEIEAV